MAGITQYVISIVGIVFLGVMVDVIMPDGEMNKFIKGMFALIIVFVIVSPIANLIGKDANIQNIVDETYLGVQIDEDFVEATQKQYILSLQNQLKAKLVNEGFENIDVTIEGYLSNNVLVIKKVEIDVSNLAFTGKNQHIDKYAEIKIIAAESLNVEESDVFIDG